VYFSKEEARVAETGPHKKRALHHIGFFNYLEGTGQTKSRICSLQGFGLGKEKDACDCGRDVLKSGLLVPAAAAVHGIGSLGVPF
jgi:hypothetical protein